jgi:twitching motility two-component system response regulator PilH
MARILLLDDSPTQTLCMQRQLQRLGHEVCHVAALSEALGLLVAQVSAELIIHPLDLALVELTLLEDNGFDVGLSLLRAGISKVLLLSGARRETDDIWAQALGLQGVLSRPLTAQRLGACVSDVLAGGHTMAQTGAQKRGRNDGQ